MDATPKIESKLAVGNLIEQLKRLGPFLLLLYLPIFAGLAALIAIYFVADIPLRIFFIDPVAEFKAPMYIGLLSNFGVLLWGAAAAVCIFAGWICFQSNRNRDNGWFLASAGLISTILMLDDLYLLHEEVFEERLFIPQKLTFAIYGFMVLALLIRFRNLILDTDFLLLALAFGFLGLSIAVDVFVEPEEFIIFNIPGRHIIEDGLKLLGIATWSVYFVRTSMQQVAPLIRES